MAIVKKCSHCGSILAEQYKFCTNCGSPDLQIEYVDEDGLPETPPVGTVLNGQAVNTPGTGAQAAPEVKPAENVIAGIVGALLFGLLGAGIYFILYQLNIIAGVCGLVTFVLANFGYGLFSGNRQGSTLGVVIAFIVMLVMIALAQYLCISYVVYDAFKAEYDINFFDAVKATPEFLKDPEIKEPVMGDLVFAYIFGIIATVSAIFTNRKNKKAK